MTWTQLADAAFELNPAELMEEIRPLFRQGIIDPSMTSLAEFEREAKRDRAISMRQHAESFHPITDTAQSISYWGRWKDSSSLYDSSTAHTPPKSTPASVPARPTVSKTARNEPCPCGSGKEYKKCCGRLPQWGFAQGFGTACLSWQLERFPDRKRQSEDAFAYSA